ncbi:MAG: lipopolysaccharide biosynthesis protein [Pseudohaliea sp.]
MLKRNLIANYLGQGWTAIMGLAFVPLYIRYLGIEAYGVIGLFTVLQSWLTMLDLGMRPALNREMARFFGGTHSPQTIRDLLRSIEILTLAVAVLIFSLFWASAGWVAGEWLNAGSLSVEAVARAFIVMGCVSGLRFVEAVYSASISGLQHQVMQNVITSTMATLRGGGAVLILAFLSPTLEAFFLWQAAMSLLTLAWLASAVYRVLPPAPRRARFSPAEVGRVWQFARGMLLITLLALFLSQFDKVLLSRLLSLESYGYYMFAANIAMALSVFTSPIVNAFYPRFSQLVAAGKHDELVEVYHLAAQALSVLVGTLGLLLVLHSRPLIQAWTGDAELTHHAAPLLSLLAAGTLLNRLMAGPYRLQLAFGWTGLTIKANAIAVAVLVPALFVVAPSYGAMGAAAVWLALNLGYFVIVVSFMHRRLLVDEKNRWYLRDVFLPLGLAFLVAFPLRLLVPELDNRLLTAALLAAVALATFAAALCGAARLRDRVLRLATHLLAPVTR